jgi:hypothetical protein
VARNRIREKSGDVGGSMKCRKCKKDKKDRQAKAGKDEFLTAKKNLFFSKK